MAEGDAAKGDGGTEDRETSPPTNGEAKGEGSGENADEGVPPADPTKGDAGAAAKAGRERDPLAELQSESEDEDEDGEVCG